MSGPGIQFHQGSTGREARSHPDRADVSFAERTFAKLYEGGAMLNQIRMSLGRAIDPDNKKCISVSIRGFKVK